MLQLLVFPKTEKGINIGRVSTLCGHRKSGLIKQKTQSDIVPLLQEQLNQNKMLHGFKFTDLKCPISFDSVVLLEEAAAKVPLFVFSKDLFL